MKTRTQYRALLGRVNGYRAAACRRLLPYPRKIGIAQHSLSLSQAIIARYAAMERRWPAMALVFDQPDRAGIAVSHSHHNTHSPIFINPRILLRMLVSQPAVKQHVTVNRLVVQSIGGKELPMKLVTSSRPEQTLHEQSDVIMRVIQRSVRVESELKNIRPTRPASLSQGKMMPEENIASVRTPILARVYRRTAQANDDKSIDAVTTRAESEKTSPTLSRDKNMSDIQSQVDITRITDQVLHALDKRIVAQRERLGRI